MLFRGVQLILSTMEGVSYPLAYTQSCKRLISRWGMFVAVVVAAVQVDLE